MRVLTGFAALALSGLVAAPMAEAAETLRAISFIPKNHPLMAMANAWVEEVNEALDGKLAINYVGGPEVMSRYQQAGAVINGIVDVAFIPAGDYEDRMPTAASIVLSRLTPSEERESGFFDFLVEEHADKLGLQYLGRLHHSPFYLWTKTEPASLADLEGLKMRTGGLYDQFMRELGMVPVTIAVPESYTALASGVADGFGWPVAGPRQLGWLDEVKNVIDIPFFAASNVMAVVNLDTFNDLPEDVQAELLSLTAEFEKEMMAYFEEENAKEWDLIGDSVNKITFSPEENERYVETAYQVKWDELAEVVPDQVDDLKAMTGN